MKPILTIEGLSVAFLSNKQSLLVLEDIHLTLKSGETLGIIGESGSGKSVLALSLLKLLPHPIAKITKGQITYKNQSLLSLSDDALQAIRGREIAYIFQDAASAFDPVIPVFKQIVNALQFYESTNTLSAEKKAIELLKMAGINDPLSKKHTYPHELSGGLRQRAQIALALTGNPKILIADEPTSALDPSHKKQIIDLLIHLKQALGLSLIFITHELELAHHLCDHTLILYAGQIVENGPTQHILKNPSHPYTQLLIKANPSMHTQRNMPLYALPGQVPTFQERTKEACHFLNRCPYAKDICKTAQKLIKIDSSDVRCCRINAL